MRAFILAGGAGQRFWPLSRELSPKQLLSMFGTESLVAQAIHRVLPFVGDAGAVTVLTNERLYDELRNDLAANPDHHLRKAQLVVEPLSRNTAPAIALAAALAMVDDPDALMVVVPSDHVLKTGDAWCEAIEAALAVAGAGHLVTIGLTARRPETGYGYIEAGEPLDRFAVGSARPRRATRFVEKPDLETARRFVADGVHYWNAGIFVMPAALVLEELAAASEDGRAIADCARWLGDLPTQEWTSDEARERFGALPSVSIDNALLELSDKVAVVPAQLEWADVGSLLALESLGEPDDAGNVRVGRGVDVDSAGTLVYSVDRLVATLGLEDAVVIDTADATLVAAKDRLQDVRQVVEALKREGAEEVVYPRTSLRPWGTWTTLLRAPRFQIKLLEIKQGAKPSLQRHRHRSEHWIVVQGTADVTRDLERIEVHENESVHIPVGAAHRLENSGRVLLRVIEVQVGEYLGEDDIVRLEDDWHREDT